jgi:hypothetical protein
LDKMNSFELLMGVLNISLPYHPYPFMIQKLDISGIAADNIYMGDLDFCLKSCSNLQIFRLERCYHISNILIQSIATHCTFLQTVCMITLFASNMTHFIAGITRMSYF